MKSFDEQLKALVDGLNETAEEIRVPRLELEKLIAKRKDEVKTEIIEESLAAFDIDPRDARKHFLSGLQNAIKGKRTVESMRTACRVYQTTQQAMIIQSRASVERFVGKFGPELVMDRRELELKNVEAVEAELVRRIEAKKAADEAAKLKAEADAAKADAAKAQAALAEANKPPAAPATEKSSATQPAPTPSNVEQGPWNETGTSNVEESAQLTADEEWQAFRVTIKSAFAPLKAAKANLVYPKNAAKAQVFASAINKVWKEEMQ